MDDISIRYVTLPELSVEGFHANVAVVWATAVVCRLVGVVGAVSGYGIMSACGVGALLAAHVTGSKLPAYANAFELSRYEDPAYLRRLENGVDNGQL